MRPALLLLVYCIRLTPCFAQDRPPDSLVKELNKHTRGDTIRLKLLVKLGEYYRYNNTDKGMAVTDEAIELAQKYNHLFYLGYAYYNREFYFYTRGDFETGLEMQKQALEIFTKIGDKAMMVNAINRIGGDYIALSDYTNAIDYLQKGLLIAEENHNKGGIARLKGNMASVFYFLADYAKAIEYALTSLQMNQEIGNLGQVALMSNNVGSMYLKIKNYPKAIEYNLKALHLNDSLGIKKGIANNYLDIGTAYFELKNYTLGNDYLSKALVIYNEIGSKYNASMALSAIAAVYNIGPDSFLQKQGVKPSQRFQKALYYQIQALASAKEVKNLDNLANQWKTLSEIYARNNRFDSALNAYKEYTNILDTIAGDKKRQEVTRQEMRFEAGKKEALLNAEHASALKRQQFIRNSIIAGSVVLLVVGLTVFSLYKRRRDAVEKQNEAELKSQVSETEMKALRAQMNPHFIFNSLNSISDYIAKNKTDLADEYLTKFAKLMRIVLENSERKEVPLSEDLKALEFYVQLEALRLNNKFTYEIKVDDDIDREATLVPPLILQPFVENSIWHGIAKKREEGKICIYIKKEGEMINCIVEDNGIGRQTAEGITTLKDNTGRRSLGMKITNERIDIINKVRKAKATVKLTDLPQGTKIEVRLPLILNF